MTLAIEHHGSIVLLRPTDDEAREWCADNLDPDAQRWGDAIVCEPRYVENILEGFAADGGGWTRT